MNVITGSQLKNDLLRSGLVLGDVVMVHASIKAIGELVGGPDLVITAISDIIGQSGTLMMYVAWEDSPYHLEDFPLEKQKAYLEELPPFNIFTSRAKRDHGILAEFLRTTSGTLRSQNPGASVCALGKDAKLITENHPFNYGYGNGSPFDQLCQLGGKILILGSPLGHITLYHYSEFLCNIANKRIVKWKCPIVQNKEKVWVEIEEFDTSSGIVDWEGDYLPLITGDYIENRNITPHKVGNADCFLFDANDLNSFAVQWMEDKFGNLEES
jgi:aminoglycoside 3-N-acetyltransferase